MVDEFDFFKQIGQEENSIQSYLKSRLFVLSAKLSNSKRQIHFYKCCLKGDNEPCKFAIRKEKNSEGEYQVLWNHNEHNHPDEVFELDTLKD